MWSCMARPYRFFLLCGGKNYPIPTQKWKKVVWPRETTQCACPDNFLLHARVINLLQQVDYTRQLCRHESSIQLKSLTRHHQHSLVHGRCETIIAMEPRDNLITHCTLIIMICCHHLPKFFLPKCLDGWICQSFWPPKFCAIRYILGISICISYFQSIYIYI